MRASAISVCAFVLRQMRVNFRCQIDHLPAGKRSALRRRRYSTALSAAGEYSFGHAPDRSGSGALKSDKYADRDVIPLWVADMDFAVPPVIADALTSRIASGVPLGYTIPPPSCTEAVVSYLEGRHGMVAEPESIVYVPGVVQSLNLAVRLIRPGASVMVFTPIYPPFLSAPVNHNRRLLEVPLTRVEQFWTFDFAAMDAAAAAVGGVGMVLLCNPHNPVGRVFSAAELRRLGEWCENRGALIVSDEIHCDLILEENLRHVPIAALDGGRFAERTVTLHSPSKTYNTPGLGLSYAVIQDAKLRRMFLRKARGIVTQNPALGYVGCEAAYRFGEPWRRQLLQYLRENRDLVYEFWAAEIPQLRVYPMEATYLAWANAADLGWKDPALEFEKAGVGLSDGRQFAGPQHVRLNFASPRSVVLEGLRRMKKAVLR